MAETEDRAGQAATPLVRQEDAADEAVRVETAEMREMGATADPSRSCTGISLQNRRSKRSRFAHSAAKAEIPASRELRVGASRMAKPVRRETPATMGSLERLARSQSVKTCEGSPNHIDEGLHLPVVQSRLELVAAGLRRRDRVVFERDALSHRHLLDEERQRRFR